MRFKRNRTGLPLRQRNRRCEDPIGIEATLEGTEPGRVVAVSCRHLFAVIRPQQVGVATRQSERGKAFPEVVCPLSVRRVATSAGLPTGDDLHHEMLLAQAESDRLRWNARGRAVEMVKGNR